jgi:magnesium-transporting ATPase (P-type)
MSSGICKNEEEEKKEKKSYLFTFWIYFGIIILGIIFLIVIILLIISLFSNSNNNNNSTVLTTPIIETNDFNSFRGMPNITTPSIPPPPLKNISIDTVSTNKKPFLSTLMTTTTENTDKAIKSFVNPIYSRTIPVKNGGFRCMNRNRF